ncbi:MAG: hypothetical protein COT61_05230 [Candidatus Portnoybacteria bacterium CG09_land_8_20_14_0_10_44_13]|uniref:HD domain-containing protein n=3 Tax=Candidatus Portnoyibacteriota TaxID=1817913 RepID=A0A2H0KQP5_9BACT|nr:MAG: hypothetical protein AUK17_01095 [Parcubacteria group bacterium CG2_30_44_18]PIQ74459.1 MAG: hypothetical protein COV85_02110 [Candidatus Portnoybacteria bacterium CG11_big_fil_rev_8_21_14_0_20_44_10]PIS16186.1 MAG: hypothetical protein COT61_05230 [Candidatus Portnoybacteria bacterium CG09_land_8_20_14_0_10_44_13]PJA63411.1 MAG: hypothetical protein CO161_01185 [Candidatus Portnoybacteria bacterium CG_4_9_14_3_um_filter_44_9]
MNRNGFEKLLRQKFWEEDVEKIMLALRLAKYGHRNQTRDSGERYFEHVKGTALILIKEANVSDRDTIIIALIHDIDEESFMLTNDDIQHIFGREVSNAIALLTKVSAAERKTGATRKEEEYIEQVRNADRKTKIVKLADRLHNLRDMKSWDQKRKRKFVDETEKYILPWAKEINKKLAEEISKICAVTNGR